MLYYIIIFLIINVIVNSKKGGSLLKKLGYLEPMPGLFQKPNSRDFGMKLLTGYVTFNYDDDISSWEHTWVNRSDGQTEDHQVKLLTNDMDIPTLSWPAIHDANIRRFEILLEKSR